MKKTTVYEVRFMLKITGEHDAEDLDTEDAIDEKLMELIDGELQAARKGLATGIGAAFNDACGMRIKRLGSDFP